METILMIPEIFISSIIQNICTHDKSYSSIPCIGGLQLLKDGHISPTQLVAIFFILIIGKEMDSGVLILIHWGHGAAELLLAISELSMAIVIILLFPLFKEPNKNIIDHFYTVRICSMSNFIFIPRSSSSAAKKIELNRGARKDPKVV